jgi:hypothetical protein
MKDAGSGLSEAIKNKSLRAITAVSYQDIAGGLAHEMIGLIRPSELRSCSPPFKMLIIDSSGTVVFECRVSKDGKVRPVGLVPIVQDSHFPATALLTDSSFVTRTFRIEHPATSCPNN